MVIAKVVITRAFTVLAFLSFGVLVSQAYSDPLKEESGPVKIGFIAPLTGPFAEWGTSLKNGMEIALGHTKHKFSVDYQDDMCESTNALAIGQRFIAAEGVNLIIGPGCLNGIEALGPLAQQKGALLFSTGLLNDAAFERHKNVLNFATQISTEAKYLGKYLSTQQISRAGILSTTDVFGEEFQRQLSRILPTYKIAVVANEETARDISDFKPIILRMMQKKPDLIFIHQADMQIGLFARQLRANGFKIPLYGYYGSQAQAVLEAGGAALEGLKYTYPVNSAELSEQKKYFDDEYGRRFNESIPTASSYFVYDGMMILDKALDGCAVKDIECIRKFFQREEGFEGVSGFMKFEKDGSTTRPFGIKQVKNGQFEWVERPL